MKTDYSMIINHGNENQFNEYADEIINTACDVDINILDIIVMWNESFTIEEAVARIYENENY